MNALSRFNFKTLPFTREIAIEDRFRLSFFDREMEFLQQAIQNRMSAALISPAGTGKTLLLRTLKSTLPEARYRIHYFKVTDLSKRDMCREISTVTGAKVASSYPALVRCVQDHFMNSYSNEGLRPVLLIDEAHDMRPSVLAMLRVLTNFKMDSQLVVSIILSGQPLLKTLLKRIELEAVARRLSHCSELRLLSREEARAYLEHRVRVAGGRTFPFDDGACEAIFEMTRGNIRALDELSRKSLEIADQGECDTVDSNHVLAAREKLPH